MQKIPFFLALALFVPLAWAQAGLVASDIAVFDGPTPVNAVFIPDLSRIDVLVRDTGSGSACATRHVCLNINNSDTGASALPGSPPCSPGSFALPGSGATTVSFSAADLSLPAQTPLGNYRIEAKVYCDSILVHQNTVVAAFIAEKRPISVPEMPQVFGFGIALAALAAVFGFFSPKL